MSWWTILAALAAVCFVICFVIQRFAENKGIPMQPGPARKTWELVSDVCEVLYKMSGLAVLALVGYEAATAGWDLADVVGKVAFFTITFLAAGTLVASAFSENIRTRRGLRWVAIVSLVLFSLAAPKILTTQWLRLLAAKDDAVHEFSLEREREAALAALRHANDFHSAAVSMAKILGQRDRVKSREWREQYLLSLEKIALLGQKRLRATYRVKKGGIRLNRGAGEFCHQVAELATEFYSDPAGVEWMNLGNRIIYYSSPLRAAKKGWSDDEFAIPALPF